MMLLLLCALLAALLLLRVTCTIRADNRRQLCVTLSWQVGRLRLRQQRIWPRSKQRKASAPPDVSRMALISELYRSKCLQRLGRHVRLHRLSIAAGLSLFDAAQAAQLCGLLNLLPSLLPLQ